MSPIALQRGSAAIVRQTTCSAVGSSPESEGDRRSPPISQPAEPPRLRLFVSAAGTENEEDARREAEDEEENSCSSSIGRNSDCSEGSGELDGEAEVESVPRGPLDSTDALEEALPMRRGISRFYAGKSKSFTSLADVSSSFSKDLAKPDNAYTRKRKNLLAFSINWDRRLSVPLPSSRGGGGTTTKRPANSSSDGQPAAPPRPPPHPNAEPRPPPPSRRCSPPPRCHFSVRSLSLTDLQSATDPAPSSIIPAGKHTGFH